MCVQAARASLSGSESYLPRGDTLKFPSSVVRSDALRGSEGLVGLEWLRGAGGRLRCAVRSWDGGEAG